MLKELTRKKGSGRWMHWGWLPLIVGLMVGMVGCGKSHPPIVALLSDYGEQDPYVAQLKGAVLTVDPNVNVVDLTHQIEPYNLRGAAFVLQQAAAEFPAGTIFIAVVAPGVGAGHDPLLIKTQAGHYFLCPDNGITTLALESEGVEAAWILDKPAYWRHASGDAVSHGRDVFAPVAGHLAAGVSPDQLGTPTKNIERLAFVPPRQTGSIVTGQVIRVDRFGNLITNIPEDFAPFLKQGVQIKLLVGDDTFAAPLVAHYEDIPEGRYGILVNSSGLLQISINQGSAARQLKIGEGTSFRLQR